jgi:CubicO group peptidase (beta-lactamase class C family)
MRKEPEEVGLDKSKLDQLSQFMRGRGCIVRYGYLVYTWGDDERRGDVASAAKPVYAHFLFLALQQGRIQSLEEKVSKFVPAIEHLNPGLDHKDREITLRQMANQTSCYGVIEKPGSAYCYNDWQMALFWDILFLRIFRSTYPTVDQEVLRPLLIDRLECEHEPTFMAFGTQDRPGRLSISPRDFARFGLLYLNGGKWGRQKILEESYCQAAVSSPLPATLPRAGRRPAEMLPEQRSIGSTLTPDNQNEHEGSYSYLWWVNGTNSSGRRYWEHAPAKAFAACGHQHGKRGLLVLPEQALVMSWNDTALDEMVSEPRPLALAIQRLVAAQTT